MAATIIPTPTAVDPTCLFLGDLLRAYDRLDRPHCSFTAQYPRLSETTDSPSLSVKKSREALRAASYQGDFEDSRLREETWLATSPKDVSTNFEARVADDKEDWEWRLAHADRKTATAKRAESAKDNAEGSTRSRARVGDLDARKYFRAYTEDGIPRWYLLAPSPGGAA
ncbi:hypothetical protein MBM_08355 [Drepanopeziza brunnea f. sp. 'multigermtubi' MB_m1]|uniref:Uncharacterized protein n=1 Tax=Marssonina brunnea f. sp. multigermtubi (strain MB_m1) TaxID=1072389 RepID=K1WMV5_MARBU|nr:uncharacterized protein MBM_08355 [Drepanopeziza brunnea f. sp. 'multigermtubi' MB_m1]EKD13637.1 hypothetical protein MBM_08355 [Drepanopeziza brunnea f. sp. 'multigermtubi' MB_m1]